MTSRHDGPAVVPGADGRPPPGGSTPALVGVITERAAKRGGVHVTHRRRLPERLPDTLWTTVWDPETGEQVTAVWTCSPDAPYQWSFDRLTVTADNRTAGAWAFFDDDEVDAALERFFP